MHPNVLHPPKSPRHCFRKCGTIAVPADLAFAGEAWSSVHDALPLVTADSDIAPEALARLLRAAYFSPSDDADADSWETQLTRFEEDALHISLKLLCSVEEARQRTIADAVWREIFWLMPRDRTVTIVVRGGKVSVDIGPVSTEAATDTATGEIGTMTSLYRLLRLRIPLPQHCNDRSRYPRRGVGKGHRASRRRSPLEVRRPSQSNIRRGPGRGHGCQPLGRHRAPRSRPFHW